MIIRHATSKDLPEMQRVYEAARAYMRSTGNTTQWINGYPSDEQLLQDIKNGNSYVVEADGRIAGTFAFILGDDPTYAVIEGKWLNDEPYGTIHRSGTDGSIHGFVAEITKYCSKLTGNIRIDTHEVNGTMRHVIEKIGYKYCGVIYISDGSPRVAYQLIVK